MIPQDPQKKHPFLAPGARHLPPGAHCDDQAMLPPVPCEGTADFDPILSAVIDHLLVIEAHQMAIAEAFTSVRNLVEELIP
jgi:hypothetical protein